MSETNMLTRGNGFLQGTGISSYGARADHNHDALMGSIVAPEYENVTFPVTSGKSYCARNGKFYVAAADIATAEEWNAAHWTETDVADEIDDLKSAIADESKPSTETTDAEGVDLDIADSVGNVIARFKDGHIQTKNFNSAAGVSNVENPYHDVLFGNDTVVPTTTHDHCTAQSAIDAMLGKGLTALAISNYHPSTPFYPVSDHGLSVGSGVTEIPNAEHVNFTNAQCHLNSIGSMFSSGSVPGETPVGVNDTWQRGIIMMKRQFLSPELGSITVNHPTWTGLPLQTILDILDFDDSVVGLEIYNQDADVNFDKGWALDTWDSILSTGRRCFGFAVPDHYAESNDKQNWKGRINLFVPENTQENCMRAIRHGRFYIQMNHTSLALTGLEVSRRSVTVSVSTSATIKTIINGAVFDTSVGTSKTVTVPDDAVYVRFEAATANDTIYTNPVMFMTRK